VLPDVMLADDLKKFAHNVHSQYGEDGIIEWIFSRIAPGNRTCVEFGAWDGRNLSNTFNLVAHRGWKAIYIEADPNKFSALMKTAASYSAITPVCSLVTSAGETALDNILTRHEAPEEFDILSIDIDGNDYDVWEASVRYRPRLVIVEFNPTFPADFRYIDRGGYGFIGSSGFAFAELASRKGYGLLGATATNLFFLRDDCFAALGVEPQALGDVLDPQAACYAFLNYADELVFSNETMARRLRSVSYAQRLKTWARRISGTPTFYVLGQQHAQSTAVLKFLRWLAALARGARHVPESVDP
jgi:Methyltransferase FkbM domain